jgi:hypothetical protein
MRSLLAQLAFAVAPAYGPNIVGTRDNEWGEPLVETIRVSTLCRSMILPSRSFGQMYSDWGRPSIARSVRLYHGAFVNSSGEVETCVPKGNRRQRPRFSDFQPR